VKNHIHVINKKSEMAVSELHLTGEKLIVLLGNFEVWNSRG